MAALSTDGAYLQVKPQGKYRVGDRALGLYSKNQWYEVSIVEGPNEDNRYKVTFFGGKVQSDDHPATKLMLMQDELLGDPDDDTPAFWVGDRVTSSTGKVLSGMAEVGYFTDGRKGTVCGVAGPVKRPWNIRYHVDGHVARRVALASRYYVQVRWDGTDNQPRDEPWYLAEEVAHISFGVWMSGWIQGFTIRA